MGETERSRFLKRKLIKYFFKEIIKNCIYLNQVFDSHSLKKKRKKILRSLWLKLEL